MAETYNGPERRTMTHDPWRTDADKKFAALDEGQVHIIKQLDEHKAHLGRQDEMLAKGSDVMQKLLDETAAVRNAVTGTRWTVRIIKIGGRGLHVCARYLAPILIVGLAIWGAVWAWFHGGKPPSVG